jgi:hypothetical protein
VHGERGGDPDIEPVDLARRRRADRETQGALPDPEGEPEPDSRGQHLAVSQPAHRAAPGRKDDGRGNHRSRQWAAARFIHTDEQQLLGAIRCVDALVGKLALPRPKDKETYYKIGFRVVGN